ncbi:hypothetical protein TMatcc_002095 [Talaromyces marneffei ATCC 18224]|nr:uncharacterized protein EYB26_006727 [Talaromyces marneffei]KAE8552084.1 hypothetical protein EYB25_005978 [Talaromyces marneffei]QGA19042.1 hypothetical protein EYB26_006727 [Talaromyces marneffei]
MSQKIQQLHSNYCIRAYYQYFHDAHPLLLPLQVLEGGLGTQHIPEKVIAVMQYIGSHFLTTNSNTTTEHETSNRGHRRRISGSLPEPSQSPGREGTAQNALEREAFSCLSRPEEDGYQVQCMLLLSITAHAHGNFLDAIRFIKSATSLALKLGMHRYSFSVVHGYGSPLLEEMWRRCYWELFVVESLLCALIEESAELYRVASDVPLPCDEGMMDLHIYSSPSHGQDTIQDLLNHCQNRAQLVDPLPSFAYRITAAHFLGSVLSSRNSRYDDTTTSNQLERLYPRLMEHVDHKYSIGGIISQPDHIAQMLSQSKVIACSAMIYFYRQTSQLTPIKLQRNFFYDQSASYSSGITSPVFPSSFILQSKHSPNSNDFKHNPTSDPSSMHLISTAKHLATQLNDPRLVRGTSPLIIDAIALAMLVEMAALLIPSLDATLKERLENEFGNSLGVLKKFAARWPLAKTVRDLLIDEYENLFRPERAR